MRNFMRRYIGDKDFYVMVLRVTIPIMIQQAITNFVSLLDNIMVGQIGTAQMSGVAIANQLIFVFNICVFGAVSGAGIFGAQFYGKGDHEGLRDTFRFKVLVCLVLSLIAMALFWTQSDLLINLYLKGEADVTDVTEVLRSGKEYLWIMIPGIIPFAWTQCYASTLKETGETVLPMKAGVTAVAVNLIFNYILIFGKFGFPALGIAGAAIGSSLAELVSLLFFILYTRSRIDCRKYGLDRIPKFRLDVLKRMLNVSFWTMIQNFFSLSTWFLFFLYVEHLGERSLAVTNIVRNVSGILFMVLMAFASTCGSLVSNLIGAGHSDCVAGTIRQHVRIAYVFVLPLALLFAVFPKLILGIYTDIPDLQDAAVHSLWVMCSTYLFLVPANVYFQAVSGTGNTRTALGMELATLVIYTAYITYIILILQLDVAICWTSEMVYSSFILIFCWLYIKRGNWQGRKI